MRELVSKLFPYMFSQTFVLLNTKMPKELCSIIVLRRAMVLATILVVHCISLSYPQLFSMLKSRIYKKIV